MIYEHSSTARRPDQYPNEADGAAVDEETAARQAARNWARHLADNADDWPREERWER